MYPRRVVVPLPFFFLDGELDMKVNGIEVVDELIGDLHLETINILSTKRNHIDGGLGVRSIVHCSKSSIARSTITGDTGEPPWAPCICR